MFVFYEICFVKNDEINKLLLVVRIQKIGPHLFTHIMAKQMGPSFVNT